MSRVHHAAILASAGSGKTFQLAHRFIHLMVHGVSPARICALTFSRKAACEIFESVVEQLVGGCTSDERRERSVRILGHPSLSADDFRGLLRGFVEGMHRARIGTLDSFMVGVVRAFPAEIGAPARFGLADGDDPEAVALRMEALSRLLVSGGDDAIGNLLDMYVAVNEGRIMRVACRGMLEAVEWYRAAYLSFPEPGCWRDPVRVWGRVPDLPDQARMKEAGDRLLEHLSERSDLPGAFAETIRQFVEQASVYRPGSPWRRFITGGRISGSDPNPLTRLLTAVWQSNGEPVECRYGRAKQPPVFAREEVRRFRCLLDVLLETQRVLACRRTDGLYRLLSAYEQHYQAAMRSSGMMTFDDVQRLLHPGASGHGLALSREPGPDRLYIDYRLDGELDHWLIDEFQDTSDQQWAVIRNLVDEVLQDDGGNRTFFCVGDVKQAIYGWRGGNAALFGEVLDTYGDRIRTRPMHECQRSCPAVLDAVNRVFGHLELDLIPESARTAWNAAWTDHTAARDEPGYACLLETTRPEGGDREERSPWAFVADLVGAIQPRKRGWTVGVLTRRNEVAGEVGDAIRAGCPGLEVAVAGSRLLADNPVVHTLLALIRFATHPGHTQAWRQLQMSPLRAGLERDGWGIHNLPAEILRRVAGSGYRDVLETWGRRLEQAVDLDRFGLQRLTQLLDAAAAYDRTGDRDGNHFLETMEHASVEDAGAGAAVQVMTIHKAKGLGFDIVILPELVQRKNMILSGVPTLLTHGSVRAPLDTDWVLRTPESDVLEFDDALAGALDEERDRRASEALCVWYVAMTRARRALYMVMADPPKSGRTLTPALLFRHQLAGEGGTGGEPREVQFGKTRFTLCYETGRADWYEEKPFGKARRTSRKARSRRPLFRATEQPVLDRREPSKTDAGVGRADWLLNPESRAVREFGSAIHELFCAVTWSGEADVEAVVADWERETAASPDVRRDVVPQFRNALQAGAIREALARPKGNVALWREKAFDVVLDNAWVSGVFDRVTIIRNARGEVERVDVVDFKSNRIHGGSAVQRAAESYADQMRLYRQAAGEILGVPVDRVYARLIFTVPLMVVDVTGVNGPVGGWQVV